MVFRLITLLPLIIITSVLLYLMFLTNLPQMLYIKSVRNVYFDCTQFVPDDYVYKMKPGQCRLKNLEYDTVLTHDADGFRNQRNTLDFDVAAIGASQTQGVGVADDQTYPAILETEYHYRTRNLGLGACATLRELEILSQYGKDAKYVVIQYTRSDFGENTAALNFGKDEFRSQVETRWRNLIANYQDGKRQGYKKPIHDLAVMVTSLSFESKAAWRKRIITTRNMEAEAAAFSRIIERSRELLEGKRLIILESSDFGLNSPRFVEAFGSELRKINWLSYRLIDSTKVLSFADHFFLDDHPKPRGQKKLATAVAAEITQWESAEPIIRK